MNTSIYGIGLLLGLAGSAPSAPADLARNLWSRHQLGFDRAALWVNGDVVVSKQFDGAWELRSVEATGAAVARASGAGQHLVTLQLDDGSILVTNVAAGAEVQSDESGVLIAYHPDVDKKQFADELALLQTNCWSKARVQSWSLGGCLTGGGLNPGTGCREWKCSAGTDNCNLTWEDVSGVVHSDNLACGNAGTFQNCTSDICWDWGDGK